MRMQPSVLTGRVSDANFEPINRFSNRMSSQRAVSDALVGAPMQFCLVARFFVFPIINQSGCPNFEAEVIA